MPAIQTQNPTLTNRISQIYKIKDWLRLYGSPAITPTVVINDRMDVQIKTFNTERITAGTTALVTTPAVPAKTWITGFTLQLSQAVQIAPI